MTTDAGGISAVILNWKRPQNLPAIIASLKASGLLREVIVWNNNPDSNIPPLEGVKQISTSYDLGLNTRFAAACLARRRAVLIQDDDLIIPADTVRKLYSEWLHDSEILHGIIGRTPNDDGSYAKPIRVDALAPIVLTRALITRRDYAAEFLRCVADFDRIQESSVPYGNGEDIIFSYVVRRLAGRMHRIHALPIKELRDRIGIYDRDRKAHLAHRTRLMHECEAWLSESNNIHGVPVLSPIHAKSNADDIAVLVMGPEGCGNRLAAAICGRLLNSAIVDKDVIDDAELIAQMRSGKRVMIRSLPHGGLRSKIGRRFYKPQTFEALAGEAGYRLKVVVPIRDRTCSISNKVLRHCPDESNAANENQRSAQIIGEFLSIRANSTFLWSYETLMWLGDAYIAQLAEFLGSAPTSSPVPLKDGNVKYYGRR